MVAVTCPICDNVIEVDEGALDAVVLCSECGEAWRVAAVRPPVLVYADELDDEEALDADEERRSSSPT